MIFDKINNLNFYIPKHIFFQIEPIIIQYKNNFLCNVSKEITKYIFYKTLNYNTKNQDVKIEAHEIYIDLQLVLIGEENILLYDINDVNIECPYSKEIDCEYYRKSKLHPVSFVTLNPRYFIILMPGELHQSQICHGNQSENISKIVFKIDEKFFKSK
ncbi:MAG: YhcH/YjgK/YiaL family protein [Bacteroidota bacterium]